MSIAALTAQEVWANRTNVHWAGLTFALALAFGLLVVPRRWAPMMLIALACFIPAGQRLTLLTLDFTFLRILVLFGWLRLALRREYKAVRPNAMDTTFFAWAAVSLVAYTTRHGTPEALIYKLGGTFDAIGLYVFFRCIVRTWVDLEHVALALALLSIPSALTFGIEHFTGRNLLSFLGGVPEFTDIREGRLRCQGAFAHPILAGCFWAAAWPLVMARWWTPGRNRALVVASSLCAMAIVFFTASSTPLLAAIFTAIGASAFMFRRYLGVMRIAILALVVGLHLVMQAPVWHLLARVNVVGGSTGWHRYYLIDETIKHFGEWWFIGSRSTAHWGLGLQDITNQYVSEAVQGGILGLSLFIGLVFLGFRTVGRSWRSSWPERAQVALAWALGVSLLVQCVSFIGVAFFDQTGVIWFLVLACLARLSALADPRGGVSPVHQESPVTAFSAIQASRR